MGSKIYSYGRQTIEQDDIEAVAEVLKGKRLTQGQTVSDFEKALSEKFGSAFCTALSSGTAALHLAALSLGWQKGDIVITTPITFLASANCILYAGATPDFVDINENSYTLDVEKLEQKISLYKKKGKKIKAVVAVDYAGHPCDWKALRQLADKYGFQLVNDNCHALGAEIDDDIAYAAKYADLAVASFHPVKPITTGEGGAVLTNDNKIDEKIKLLRTHGIMKESSRFKVQSSKLSGPWYYEMQELGFNYRITDFQCALGISQLKKLDSFIQRRREIAAFYDEQFATDDRFIIPAVKNGIKHSYHLYPLQIKFDMIGLDKTEYFSRLKTNRIIAQVHYIPIHFQPYYQKRFGFRRDNFPVAERFYKREVSIPIYPLLEQEDLNYIVKTLKLCLE